MARGRAADLLVRREQERDRQLRGLRARDLPERFEREIRAALHVEQAGPVELVAVAAERERPGKRADRMHGVDVRHDQDAGAAPRRLVAHDQIVREPVSPRHALDRHGQVRDIGLHHVDHAVDGGLAAGRAFGFDPALDAGDHGAEVDGCVLRHAIIEPRLPHARRPHRRFLERWTADGFQVQAYGNELGRTNA